MAARYKRQRCHKRCRVPKHCARSALLLLYSFTLPNGSFPGLTATSASLRFTNRVHRLAPRNVERGYRGPSRGGRFLGEAGHVPGEQEPWGRCGYLGSVSLHTSSRHLYCWVLLSLQLPNLGYVFDSTSWPCREQHNSDDETKSPIARQD
jgi:hypothetical protein